MTIKERLTKFSNNWEKPQVSEYMYIYKPASKSSVLSFYAEEMEKIKAEKNENQVLETGLADRSIWLMKCPSLVAPSLQYLPFPDDPYRHVAKVTLSIDPLAPEEEEAKVFLFLSSFSRLLHFDFGSLTIIAPLLSSLHSRDFSI